MKITNDIKKYELEQETFIDNDFINYSNAFKGLTNNQLTLLIYLINKNTERIKKHYSDLNAIYDILLDPARNNKLKALWKEELIIDVEKVMKALNKEKLSKLDKTQRLTLFNELETLQNKSFRIKKCNDKGEIIRNRSFSYVQYIDCNEETKKVSVKFAEDNIEVFMRSMNNFTKIDFENIHKLKMKSSKVMYLYFKSWEYIGNSGKMRNISLEKFKTLMGLEDKYEEYKILKRDVLIPALTEINTKTDLFIFGHYTEFFDNLNNINPLDFDNKELIKLCLKSMELTERRKIKAFNFRSVSKDNYFSMCKKEGYEKRSKAS